VTLEARIGLDAHEQVEVAGRPTAGAGMASSREPDALAVLDPFRHVDRERLHAELVPAAAAQLARRGSDLAVAAAGIARHRSHELPEHAA
jgi:hypothetical protein